MGESRFPEQSIENDIPSILSGDAFATSNHMRCGAWSLPSPRRKLSIMQKLGRNRLGPAVVFPFRGVLTDAAIATILVRTSILAANFTDDLISA